MYYIGVDIGQARDYTAIAALQVHQQFREKQSLPNTIQYQHEPTMVVNKFRVKLLEQMALQTKYSDIVERVKKITSHIEIARAYYLIVDMTGVGRPVVEMMQDEKLAPVGVNITGGKSISENEYGLSVPKTDLVSSLLVMFQTGRLQLNRKLEEYQNFKEQLDNFSYRISAKGHETFEAEREKIHDDLVLATALAAWYAAKNEGREAVGMHGNREYERDDFDPLKTGLM